MNLTYIDALHLVLILLAYLLGSLSSAIFVSRCFGLPDPRKEGSNNPGATNMMRLGGRLPAAITLTGDVLKGVLPVALGVYFELPPWLISALFFAAVIGHVFPIYTHFQGGKGVATYIGGLIGLSPPLAGLFISVWLLVFLLCRISSLAAMVALIVMPIAVYFLMDMAYLPVFIALTIIILWRHKSNITRLCQGQESQIK